MKTRDLKLPCHIVNTECLLVEGQHDDEDDEFDLRVSIMQGNVRIRPNVYLDENSARELFNFLGIWLVKHSA